MVDNINTNMAMAVVVLVVFNAVGISRNGPVAYFKHLLGPVWWLAPLLFVVEAMGRFRVRAIYLSLRLTGSTGIFVSFIQALVFTLLSSVYIAVAAAHEGGDHH